MKKFAILAFFLGFVLSAFAQYDMSVWINGEQITHTTTEVDSVTFVIKNNNSTTDPEPLVGTYYITGNDALLSENVWLANAILMTKEGNVVTHTFRSVPAGSYCQFKITIGDWAQNWGFAAVANPPAGVTGDADGNVVFTMASTSDVKVTFDGTNISLTGDFVGGSTPTPDPEPEPEPDPEPEPEPEPSGDVTVKAQVPASWTNTITAWVWPTGGEGREIVPTKEGKWYVITETCSELNIIFKNGIGWNGDNNQTVDMTFTKNTCIAITTGMEKATYTVVDCEGSITPEPEPEPVIGPYYITGNEVLVGSDLAWKADAIKMTQDGNVVTHTFTNLPANEECQFKITNGDWSQNWGFEDVANPPAGVSVDINLHGNVVFYLAQPGDVTVTFDGTNISLSGNFRSW